MNRKEEKIKIAYLAPEIPALSATFVYNEILSLEELGFEIIPLSVHFPTSLAKEDKLESLIKRTHYIYQKSLFSLLQVNISTFLKHPIRYISTLLVAIRDSIKMGLFTRISFGLFYRFCIASHIVIIIEKEGCKHLHAQFAHIPTDIAMYASGISGIPFSFTSHANDLFERGWLLEEKVNRAKFAATISEYNLEYLINQGAPSQKIHIVRCGVNSDSFSKLSSTPINSIPKIGTLGRMVEKKGFDTLIRSGEILKRKGFPFQMEIAGDGPLKSELENLVLSLDLTEQINFIGPLSHDSVPTWLQQLDLFVLPCRKDSNGDMDGIPVVLMEAMMSGVPVISTRLSGIPELIEDGKTGYLADPENAEELSDIIEKIYMNGSQTNIFCRNAIEKIESEFDLLKNVTKLSHTLEGVIS
jgi:colanic acid/amylovoran biosynthesis glycosyltransferase